MERDHAGPGKFRRRPHQRRAHEIRAPFPTALNVTSDVPVEYRIYGFGAGTTGGLLQIDNVALTFASPVPEPSAVATLGFATLLGGFFFARRRR